MILKRESYRFLTKNQMWIIPKIFDQKFRYHSRCVCTNKMQKSFRNGKRSTTKKKKSNPKKIDSIIIEKKKQNIKGRE